MVSLPLERRPRSFSHVSHSVWSWDLRQADIERQKFLFACLPHQPAVQHRASIIPQVRSIDSNGGDGHQVNIRSRGWEGRIRAILDTQ